MTELYAHYISLANGSKKKRQLLLFTSGDGESTHTGPS
jgi:hypothetical protein